MLKPILALNRVEISQLFDFLYGFFHRDFVAARTFLNGKIWINPQSYKLDEGKEEAFWHLTSRDQERLVKRGNQIVKEKERLPDFRRAERIEWVKQIIDNHSAPSIKCFYHKETKGKKEIRLYLWAYDDDFVVILQKLGKSSSFLVTSFFVDYQGKRSDFEKRYQTYIGQKAPELKGCEWF